MHEICTQIFISDIWKNYCIRHELNDRNINLRFSNETCYTRQLISYDKRKGAIRTHLITCWISLLALVTTMKETLFQSILTQQQNIIVTAITRAS